jgi:hypothetical protein
MLGVRLQFGTGRVCDRGLPRKKNAAYGITDFNVNTASVDYCPLCDGNVG